MAATDSMCLAVFDCGGTIVDTQHMIVAAVRAAWAVYEATRTLPLPDPEQVRRNVGLPLEEPIAQLMPTGSPDDHRRLTNLYKEAYRSHRREPDYHEPLYDGVADALDRLRLAGFLLGIATGKSRRGAVASLAEHDLLGRFAVVKTADDGPGKPNPHMLLEAMRETGADSGATVMIGDTTFDMTMAREATCGAVGVSWGYHGVDELRSAGAHAIAERCADLPAIFTDIVSRVHDAG